MDEPIEARRANGTEWMAKVPHGFDALGDLDDAARKVEMDAVITRGRPMSVRENLHASTILKPDLDYHGKPNYCPRECVLAQFYQTNEVIHSPKTIMIFQNGWELHRRWQTIFHNAGIAIETELAHEYRYLYADYLSDTIEEAASTDFEFTPDAAIMFDGEPHMVEVKGYRQETYFKLIKGGYPHDAYTQCQLYMSLYRLKGGGHINKGLIIVENKNSQEYFLWRIERVTQPIEHIVERLNTISLATTEHRRTGALPTGICEFSSDDRAVACSMRDACFLIRRVPLGVSREIKI